MVLKGFQDKENIDGVDDTNGTHERSVRESYLTAVRKSHDL